MLLHGFSLVRVLLVSAIPIQSTVIWRMQLKVILACFWFYLYWYRAVKYTFRGPNILLKQYSSKQGFGIGHPEYLAPRGIKIT